MFQKLKNYMLKTKSRTFSAVLKTYNGVTQWVSKAYKLFAEEGYEKNVYVYSAIRAISKSVSSPTWSAFKNPQKKGDDLEKILNHPAERLLNKPNPHESGREFRAKMMEQILIYGNAYIEKIESNIGGKKKVELYLLRPDRMTIVPAKNKSKGLVKEYIYEAEGHQVRLNPKNILHIKMHHPSDDLYGLSPIKVAGMAVDQNNLTKKWNIDILNNGGMPSGSLSTDQNLTEGQYNSLESQLNSYNLNKNGEAMILEAGLKFERFSMTSEDMSWIQAVKMSAREISIVFGVPPEILGDSTNKTYNNYTQARKAFYEETILVWLDQLTEKLGNWVLEIFENDPEMYTLTYNKEGIEAIQEDISMKWEKANNSHFISFNEKRNLVGYEDIEGGDIYAVPNTMTLIRDLKDVGKVQGEIDKIRQELESQRNNEEVSENEDESEE